VLRSNDPRPFGYELRCWLRGLAATWRLG
jgi:hypothetical protein